MPKKIQVAPATLSTWVTLPGNTGDFSAEGEMIDDTVYGQNYKSEQPDIMSWMMNSNAIYKGYSGYQAVLKKVSASATVMTNEACALVSGKTYRITAATKRVIDPATTLVIKDGATDQTANVLSVDLLFGTVTFKSTYTVTGAVTVTGAYLPTAQICSINKYTLTMQAEAVDNTDLCVAQTNSGFRQYKMGLKTVSCEMSGFYNLTSGFLTALTGRGLNMLEINADGASKSVARGFFRMKSQKQSGKVGALEDESVSFSLAVPDHGLMAYPFSWSHDVTSTLNTGVQTLLSAFQNDALVEARYLPDGVAGLQGSAVPTNVSLSGGMGALNEFSVQMKGSGGITVV